MSFKRRIYKTIERILAKYTDKIVCISEAEVSSALSSHIVPKEKLVLISNGINIEAVREAIPFRRSELQIPEEALVVGMVGRLTRQKAPDVFIKSAKLIMEYIPNTYFIIVGEGEMKQEIIEYAETNHIPLLVTGWIDDPYRYMKVFDIAMLLSRWEGFGLAIAEYMAAEKIIVATNVDAIPMVIENGKDGLLIASDHPEEAANKVRWIVEHPVESEIMKQNAKKKVKDEYNVNRVAKQHVELFRELLKANEVCYE